MSEMEKMEDDAKRMSDEILVESLVNARLILFARGLVGRRPPWSPDGNVQGPWQEFVVLKREIFRRMGAQSKK